MAFYFLGGFGTFLFSFFVLLAAAAVGVYFYCEKNKSNDHCIVVNEYAEVSFILLRDWYQKSGVFLAKVADYLGEMLILLKVESSKMLDYLHRYYTNLTKT